MISRRNWIQTLCLSGWLIVSAIAHAGDGSHWLQNQAVDGAYPAGTATAYEATAEALYTLRLLDALPAELSASAGQFLAGEPSAATKYLARHLMLEARAGHDISALLTALDTRRNPDGGFGGYPGYRSTVQDTAFALHALAAAGQMNIPAAAEAVTFLQDNQTNGSWSDGAVYPTALAAGALLSYRAAYGLDTALQAAAGYLLTQYENRDISIWEDFMTALVVLAAVPVVQDSGAFQSALDALQAAQQADGSWDGDVYTTALALRALAPPADSDFGTLRGIVLDGAGGLPLAGFTVSLTGTYQHYGSTQTAADGSFVFERLSAGQYRLNLGDSVNVTTNLERAQNVDLGALRVFHDGVTRIAGTVSDAASGTGLAGAEIRIDGETLAYSDAQGNYLVNNPPGGPITLQASKSDYLSVLRTVEVTDGQTFLFSPALYPAQGDAPTPTLSGRVEDWMEGTPLAGVTVAAGTLGTVTDDSGAFSLDELPADTFLSVLFHKEGYQDSRRDFMLSGFSAFDLGTIKLSSDANPAPAGFSGVVMDASDSAPLADAVITGQFGAVTLDVVPDADGVFSHSGLTDYAGELVFAAEGYHSVTYTLGLTAGETLDLMQIRLRPKVLLPDLTVTTVTAPAHDPRTLQLADGAVVSTRLENIGTADANAEISLTAFFDADRNGVYEAGVDLPLGKTVTEPLATGRNRVVEIAVTGLLPFRDAPLSVVAHTDVTEMNLSNNKQSTANKCKIDAFDIADLEPIEKWHWDGSKTSVYPQYQQVMSTPVVGPLEDTNGDGLSNHLDIPTVVFLTFKKWYYHDKGILRAVNGDTGKEIWSSSQYDLYPISIPAIADIDNDGEIEVVVIHRGGGLIAFDHTGTKKWESSHGPDTFGALAIADLFVSNDPYDSAEIVFKNHIMSGKNGDLMGYCDISLMGVPVVADINLDGYPDLLTGNQICTPETGRILWAGDHAGHTAIANLSGDEYPELIVVNKGVFVYEHEFDVVGNDIWQQKWSALPENFCNGNGGPPTIAELNPDSPGPEIGVAGACSYTTFSADGGLLWSKGTQDESSANTGSSVFDFNADGNAEVIYADETHLRIYNGKDGEVIYQTENPSGTVIELPVIVDVDNDNHAEIVVASNNYYIDGVTGVRVFEGQNDNWANTRKIWNQHSYHINNINDDGTVPEHEEPSWLTHNTYRLNTFPDNRDPLGIPDLTAGYPRLIDNGLGQPYSVRARIGSAGLAPATATVTLDGTDSIATVTLAPGEYRDIDLPVTGPLGESLSVSVDSANAVAECDETNNTIQAVLTLPVNTVLSTDAATDKTTYGPRETVTVSYRVTNHGRFPADAQVSVTILEIVEDDDTGPVEYLIAELDSRTLTALASGETQDFTAGWHTGTILSGEYTVRVTVSDSDGSPVTADDTVFTITAGTDTAVDLRTATDRPAYHTTDTVNIENLLRNLSVNTLTEAIQLAWSVTAADGTLVKSDTLASGQLAPQARQSVLIPYVLQAAAAGDYTVTVTAYSDGIALATDSAVFTVFNDLSVSISGETGVATAECQAGEAQSCTDTVYNRGSEDVGGLAVRHLVADLENGQGIAGFDVEESLDLAAGESSDLDRPIDTGLLGSGEYACVLQAGWDDTWHTLSWAAFRVTGAPCGVYAVHNEREKDSRIITVDPASGVITPLGPQYPALNLEGLAFSPADSRLYSVAAQAESVLYLVNYTDGGLTAVGTVRDAAGTPFEAVSGLAFRADGSLWAYARQGKKAMRGIIEIDPATAVAKVWQQSMLNIESLAWSGDTLWLFKNKELHRWDGSAIHKAHQVNALPGNIEGLDALPDGRLLISIHHGGHLNLYVLDGGRIEREAGFPTEAYDNLEAVAWPWHCEGRMPPVLR